MAGDRCRRLEGSSPDPGIGIKGARIDGRIDLQASNIVFGIYLDHCAIAAGINLLVAEIHALNLSGCHAGRITADGIKVEAGVFLRGGFRMPAGCD